MSEEVPVNSIRQLPPGQLNALRKRFESESDSNQIAENGVKLRPKHSAHSSPVHQRPTTAVLDSPIRGMNKERVRPKSVGLTPSSSPNVLKVLNKFEPKGNGGNLHASPNLRSRESSPHKPLSGKPAISKKPSFTKADNNGKPQISRKPSFSTPDEKRKPFTSVSSASSEDENEKQSKPVSVVQQRTQMFEAGESSADSPSINVKSAPPPRPAPPAKPSSRPPSVGCEEQEGPVYSEVNKRKKSEEQDTSNSQYCEAWDTRPVSKFISGSSPAKHANTPPPPPMKPPRTGAHDEYMLLKKQGVTFQLYDDVPNEEPSPVYKKITKPSTKDSPGKPEIRMARPSRPPPPRSRPVTFAGESTTKEDSAVKTELPHKPLSASSLRIYEEVNGGDFSLSNIKHWDLPLPVPPETSSIPDLGNTSLKRSLSMDSLMGSPVYCDPTLSVNFRDDSEIYVDSAGYAMPLGTPIHRALGNSASLDTDPSQGGVCMTSK